MNLSVILRVGNLLNINMVWCTDQLKGNERLDHGWVC
jgi:hypothetical protein